MSAKTTRRFRRLYQGLRHLPALVGTRPATWDITLVTGADESHFRSLMQFVTSVCRHESNSCLIAYDLGLSDVSRDRFTSQFPKVALRRFDFGRYPRHVDIRRNAGQYAWKPQIVAAVAAESERPVVWMDAGNVVDGHLTRLRRILASDGFYSPFSKGTVAEWTHPGMLEFLGADQRLGRMPNLNGACVALDCRRPAAAGLLERWQQLALVERCIAPDGSSRANHRQDQALLTVLAYQAGLAQKVYPGYLGYRIHCDVEETLGGVRADGRTSLTDRTHV